MAARIGPHVFLFMFGQVPVIRTEVEVITKPGEDGHIRRRIGERSPIFSVNTQGTYATQLAGREAFQTFSDMIGNDPSFPPDQGEVAYTFEKDDVNYTTGPTVKYRVSVLDVTLTSLDKKACITGTTNRWLLECTWTLILVPEV